MYGTNSDKGYKVNRMSLRIGIDIGSTTVKVVLLDEQNKLLFRSYERHYSKARERAAETLRSLADRLAGRQVRIVITGSAGLGVAKAAEIDFVQEVYATAAAVNQYIPDTDAVIELGGEDAKIIFFGGALEERMNGSCAGGTGAFIDQMATLMNVTVNELDELSLRHEKIYPIASRCGVFAKSDIQPILNQGGRKEDVAASIFQAVVDQTVAGLTQGRELKGKIVFLGGPLHFLMGLRQRFVDTLKLDEAHAIFPEDGDCFAAMGAIKREMNNAKWTAFAIGYMCVFAYVVSLIVYQIGGLITGEVSFGIGTVVAVVLVVGIVYLLFRKNKYEDERLTIRSVDAAGRRAALK